MAEMWKPHDIQVYREWLDDIISESSDKLNDWEENFLDSLTIKLERNYNLTQNQAEKLEELYTKHTS